MEGLIEGHFVARTGIWVRCRRSGDVGVRCEAAGNCFPLCGASISHKLCSN